MILDRLLSALLVLLAIAAVLTAVFVTFTGIPIILALAALADAGLLWLVRKTIRATLKANES